MSHEIAFKGFDKIYDIIQLCIFKLNDLEDLHSRYTNQNTQKDDMRYIKYIREFVEIDIDFNLKIFFDIHVGNVSFLSKYYTDLRKRNGFVGFEEFISTIQNDNHFKAKLISNYIEGDF